MTYSFSVPGLLRLQIFRETAEAHVTKCTFQKLSLVQVNLSRINEFFKYLHQSETFRTKKVNRTRFSTR